MANPWDRFRTLCRPSPKESPHTENARHPHQRAGRRRFKAPLREMNCKPSPTRNSNAPRRHVHSPNSNGALLLSAILHHPVFPTPTVPLREWALFRYREVIGKTKLVLQSLSCPDSGRNGCGGAATRSSARTSDRMCLSAKPFPPLSHWTGRHLLPPSESYDARHGAHTARKHSAHRGRHRECNRDAVQHRADPHESHSGLLRP